MNPTVIVDIHESDSGILQDILDIGMEATVQCMETSDVSIELDGFTVGIELKRCQDYTNSLQDGRLKDQICRLHDNFDFQVLIVQGWKPFLSNDDTELTLRDKIRRHKISLRTLNRRLTVYETETQRESVDIIWEIYRDLKNGKLQSMSRPILIEPEINPSVRLLCALPQVSRERAVKILERYGTPYDALEWLSEWPMMRIGLTEDRVKEIRKAYVGG